MTAPTNTDGIQLSLLSPNIGACVGVASREAATNGRGPLRETDTKTAAAPATTAHDVHEHRQEPEERAERRMPTATAQSTATKTTKRTAGPGRSRAESPRGSALSGRWEPEAVVVARIAGRLGISRREARKVLERLYTAGAATRAVYGETGVMLWRAADRAGVRR